MRPIPKKTRKCKICGDIIEVNIPWNRSLCSKECVYKNGIILAAAQVERKKNTVVRKKCRYCEREVVSTAYCPRSFCDGKAGQCYRSFMSEQRKGKNNLAYRNGFAVQGSRKYTGKHLRACSKYRKEFLDKEGYLYCEVCGVNETGTPKFEVHHIYFASLYPKHDELHNPKNLVLVCIGCHNKFHSSKYEDQFRELERERGLKELFKKT